MISLPTVTYTLKAIVIFGSIIVVALLIHYRFTDPLIDSSIQSEIDTKDEYPKKISKDILKNKILDAQDVFLTRNRSTPTINAIDYKATSLGKHFHDIFESATNAINHIEKIIINGDKSRKIMSIYITTCLMSGNSDRGIKFLKKHIHLNPVEFSINLGMLYFQNNDVESSRQYYEESVSNGIRSDIRPLESLANFEISQGNIQKAINLYESFLSQENIGSNEILPHEIIDNNRLQAQSELVQIFINTGNYEEANDILYKLYSEGEDTVHLQHYYSQINHLEDPPNTYEYIDK